LVKQVLLRTFVDRFPFLTPAGRSQPSPTSQGFFWDMLQETNGFCELLLFQPQPAEKSYLLVGCLQNKGDLPEKIKVLHHSHSSQFKLP
jgi:hypothetical protein